MSTSTERENRRAQTLDESLRILEQCNSLIGFIKLHIILLILLIKYFIYNKAKAVKAPTTEGGVGGHPTRRLNSTNPNDYREFKKSLIGKCKNMNKGANNGGNIDHVADVGVVEDCALRPANKVHQGERRSQSAFHGTSIQILKNINRTCRSEHCQMRPQTLKVLISESE